MSASSERVGSRSEAEQHIAVTRRATEANICRGQMNIGGVEALERW